MGRSRPAWLTHSRDRLPKRADLARFCTEPRCRTESCPQSYFLHKGGKPLVVAPNLVWTQMIARDPVVCEGWGPRGGKCQRAPAPPSAADRIFPNRLTRSAIRFGLLWCMGVIK